MPALVGTVAVPARPRWTATGLRLERGGHYRLAAAGRWTDGFITCGPEGYERALLAPLRRFRRAPGAPWFQLMGALDADAARPFPIGAGCTLSPAHDGELACFANDLCVMAWNNRGAVTLQVWRER